MDDLGVPLWLRKPPFLADMEHKKILTEGPKSSPSCCMSTCTFPHRTVSSSSKSYLIICLCTPWAPEYDFWWNVFKWNLLRSSHWFQIFQWMEMDGLKPSACFPRQLEKVIPWHPISSRRAFRTLSNEDLSEREPGWSMMIKRYLRSPLLWRFCLKPVPLSCLWLFMYHYILFLSSLREIGDAFRTQVPIHSMNSHCALLSHALSWDVLSAVEAPPTVSPHVETCKCGIERRWVSCDTVWWTLEGSTMVYLFKAPLLREARISWP